MLNISEQEIIKRLQFDNPWWQGNEGIDSYIQAMPKRAYFSPFFDHISDRSLRRAIILMGPRRVGKTIMVSHAIDKLLQNDTQPHAIFYISLETPVYTGKSLEQLLNIFLEHHQHTRHSPLYIFFDEIQYLKDWEIHLKSLVDSYPSYKFVATGSAAAALRLKSQESGAGRFSHFILPPLTFAEYLHFSNKQSLIEADNSQSITAQLYPYRSPDIRALNDEFLNYLNYGGYPEAIFSERIRHESGQFIKSDIIDKVLLRDLPSLYGIQDIQELNRLFTTLAYNTGQEVSLEKLASTSGVAKNTLKRYLEYLEAAFLIKRVHRLDQNAQRFKRATMFKVYLTNPSMRSALFGNVDSQSEAMGALVETAIYAQWLHSTGLDNLYYARWDKGEVDIVHINDSTQKPNWLLELKWSDLPYEDNRKLESLLHFACLHQETLITPLLVTTKTITANKELDGQRVIYLPNSIYAFLLSTNLVQNHQQSSAISKMTQP
ncbi:MAG: ATP-binding protein [Pseudomonadales bacterium]|nr:ATP-binding protein [Pseudomonadales bacterium]